MLLMLVALLSGLLSLSPPQVCASDVGVLYEMMLERALGLRLKICAICTHECPNHSVRDIRKAWANEELKYLGLIDIIVRGLVRSSLFVTIYTNRIRLCPAAKIRLTSRTRRKKTAITERLYQQLIAM